MANVTLGTVRMTHVFGGPDRVVPCVQTGNAIFIEWPLQGLIRIVVKTGKLWDSRKGPWTMHHEDLRRVTVGVLPYEFKPAMRKYKGLATPSNFPKRNPPVHAPGAHGRKSSV